MKPPPRLWNRNFSLAVAGMVISALGGVGLNLAMGVLVFQETQSTILASVFTALSFVPEFVLPLVIGPYVDRRNPLKVLVRNEVLLAFLFLGAAAVTWAVGFHYVLYLGITLAISCLGVVSNLAANSIIPQIMDKANYTRGNAVISTIYPLCQVLVVPLAMILFERFGIPLIFAAYGVCCLMDACLESHIRVDFEYIQKKAGEKTTLREYAADLKEGFGYFRADVAIRAVFLYFTFTMFCNETTVLIYPFFNLSETLTNASYAMLETIRSAGYMLGGLLHYAFRIPDKYRYAIAIGVYTCFLLMESTFFFMPLWLMCATRFVLGVLGMNSANIRVSAVQHRVPARYRAKVNAFFQIMVSTAMMAGRLVAGAMGEAMDFWVVQMAFTALNALALAAFMLPRRNKVRGLYNYSTAAGVAPAGEGIVG
jgi:hypothetical protein